VKGEEKMMKNKDSYSKNIYKSIIIIFFSLLMIFFVTGYCLASNSSEGENQTNQNQDYTLNYRDVLEIQLWGYPELTRKVPIQPDGMMSLPIDGQIYAVGKTLEEVRIAIVQEMKKVLPSLEGNQVSLTIVDFSKTDISVLGEVKSPGLYPVSGKVNVLKAISFAGGLLENAGLKNATIIRESGEVTPVDLEKLFHDSDMSQNITLYSGDSLFIPKAFEMKTISVAGEVNSPGLYSLEGRIDVLKAISIANGFTARADLKNATVNRQSGELIPVNLEKLLLENDFSQNVVLEYGDSLFIPMTLENNIYVLGEVKTPGLYNIEGTCSVVEAISIAGGYNEKAKLSSCLVIRKFPQDEEGIEMRTIELKEVKVIREEYDQVIEIDLKEILKNGHLAQNINLQPQDIVYLPARPLSELDIDTTLDIIQTGISIYSVLK